MIMEIRRLKHQDIDRLRWDQTVHAAPGPNLYARSWYLDAVCPDWEALASPDYSYVMPLAPRKRFTIPYLYQPLLSQQHGILSAQKIEWETVQAFLECIPQKYRLIEITLNERNPVGDLQGITFHTTLRTDLSHGYDQISASYNDNTKRNLKKADTATLTYETGIPAGQFLSLLMEDEGAGSRILLKKSNRKPLLRLINALMIHQAGEISGIRNSDGTLLSAALFARQENMHFFLAPASAHAGRESRAMFMLIDRYIHLHAGSRAMLDFEGSDIPDVARFYRGFGAAEFVYPSFRLNRLPFPLKNLADRRIR